MPPDDDASPAALQAMLEEYQKRLDQHEQERADTAARVHSIEVNQLELEQLRQTVSNKDAKIAELEHRLTSVDAEVYRQTMFAIESRGQLERTQIELATKKEELSSVIAMQPPVTQSAKFYRDCRPECVTAKKASPEAQSGGKRSRQQGAKQQQQSSSVRIIYLPYERTEQLLQLVKSLSCEVERHKRAAVEREAAVTRGEAEALATLKDRIREAEQTTWQAAAAETQRRAQLLSATSDLVRTRRELQMTQRKLAEITVKNERATAAAQRAAHAAKTHLQESGTKAAEDAAAREAELQNEVARRDDVIQLLKGQFEASQEFAKQRIEKLTARLADERDKRQLLEKQRRLEREGVAWDIQQLTTSLRRWESRKRGHAHWSKVAEPLTSEEVLEGIAATASLSPDRLAQEVADLKARLASCMSSEGERQVRDGAPESSDGTYEQAQHAQSQPQLDPEICAEVQQLRDRIDYLRERRDELVADEAKQRQQQA